MVSLITTAISVLIACMAAYALARLKFKGRAIVLSCILAISMFPNISMISPIYMTISKIGLQQYLVGSDYSVFVVCYAFVGVVFDHILSARYIMNWKKPPR